MRLSNCAPFFAAAFFGAIAVSGAAYGKACVQLTGGACQGHWECKTADGSAGFCDDDLLPKGTDCYCKKGKKTSHHRASHMASHCGEDQPCAMEGVKENTQPATQVSQPASSGGPTVIVKPGYEDDQHRQEHEHKPDLPIPPEHDDNTPH